MAEKIVKQKLSAEYYNQMAQTEPQKLVAEAEADYYNQIEKISSHIAKNKERYKVVLLAGPSGSGKTTTASNLRKQLRADGIQSVYVSLDNFFLNRDDLPLLPDGTKDFESLQTLDMECLHQFFGDLLTKNQAQIPIFDFPTGCRTSETIDLKIDENFVVIIEGLHALNPAITAGYYEENFCKIYISPKSEFEYNQKVILNSRNIRLIRRMVRDYHFRSSSAENTLNMWKNVIAAEDLYIRPFRLTADFWIDSTHKYEPMIMHHDLLPILKEVTPEHRYYQKCMELEWILEQFYDLNKEMVPENSLLREFIG